MFADLWEPHANYKVGEPWTCAMCQKSMTAGDKQYPHTRRENRCAACNSLRTKMFGAGQWGNLLSLKKEDQLQFFRENSEERIPQKDFESRLQSYQKSTNIETQFRESGDSGELLPLSVWVQRGFDPEQIVKDCVEEGDTEYVKGMGLCYRLYTKTDRNVGSKGWRNEDTTSSEPSGVDRVAKSARTETPAETAKRIKVCDGRWHAKRLIGSDKNIIYLYIYKCLYLQNILKLSYPLTIYYI